MEQRTATVVEQLVNCNDGFEMMASDLKLDLTDLLTPTVIIAHKADCEPNVTIHIFAGSGLVTRPDLNEDPNRRFRWVSARHA